MTKRRNIQYIRDQDRAEQEVYNENGVYLPNPSASPSFDRHSPISSERKALAFGMEAVSPKRLFELPKGDAGAGQSVYRRLHVFYSTGSLNYTKPIAAITNRASTQSPRYFLVSVYGFGVRRPTPGAGIGLEPLSIAEAQDRQLEAIYVNTVGFPEVTRRFLPSVCTCQARIMVHDESGQRFFDVDVIGSRSMAVYGWGVTVFLLTREDGYEVDSQNKDSIRELGETAFAVEDDVVGARVLPIFSNKSQNNSNRTLSVFIDPSVNRDGLIIPIPPGSKTVQIFSNEPTPGAGWVSEFWFGRSGAIRPTLGIIDFETGQSKTAIIEIPNAPSIIIEPRNAAVPPAGFSLVFEVEP